MNCFPFVRLLFFFKIIFLPNLEDKVLQLWLFGFLISAGNPEQIDWISQAAGWYWENTAFRDCQHHLLCCFCLSYKLYWLALQYFEFQLLDLYTWQMGSMKSFNNSHRKPFEIYSLLLYKVLDKWLLLLILVKKIVISEKLQ